MKRLELLPLRHRRVLQAGGLCGLGLAFLAAPAVYEASAGEECPSDADCSFKKPNFMIVMDYSTSMNHVWEGNETRWDVTVEAVKGMVEHDNGFMSKNTHLALLRFGHDPNPNAGGTTIAGDDSGIVDGQALDVAWYDAQSQDKTYIGCNGQAIVDALDTVGPPMDGELVGIGTWTKGGLDRAAATITTSKQDHPADDDRLYLNLVLTDGAWTGANGTGKPDDQNPTIAAAAMFDEEIPTYVVAVAEDADLPEAHALAQAGGTGAAFSGDTPEELIAALVGVVDAIKEEYIQPVCTGGMPRVMIILDASSSMLNIGCPQCEPGPMGETGWDQARGALAGDASLFDVLVTVENTVEDLSHLGLLVFGHNAPNPGEHKLLVQYGPCMRDNFEWALDPENSCLDGCNDPWGGPPIDWTFQDGSVIDPMFDAQTLTHMPLCNGNQYCTGSGTYTHLGLELAAQNQSAYHAEATLDGALYPADDTTTYINILITDGQYSGYSTDLEVQTSLETMYGDGITTYVIGFGDGLETQAAQDQLTNMANWGSAGTYDHFDAGTQEELEASLKSILEGVEFDPCCGFNDCSENPEPTTGEPDPVEGETDTEGESETGDTGESETGDTGESDTNETGDTGESDTNETGDTGESDTNESGDEGDSGEDGGGTETDGESADTIGPIEDGCNCSSSGKGSGWATFLTLGLAGLLRRRTRPQIVA